MKIAFIGIGNMGGPMCRNILKNSDHEVTVFDLSAAAVARCTELGAKVGESPRAVAADADVVMTSLPHPRDVEQVVLGTGGIAESIKPGAVYCDLSTNSPLMVRKLSAVLGKQGVSMLDAPVSGSVVAADKGTLAVMVGGARATFDRLESVLKCFGENVVYCGDTGTGCVAKIANNLIAFCNVAASAEGLMLGVAGVIQVKFPVHASSTGHTSASTRNALAATGQPA